MSRIVVDTNALVQMLPRNSRYRDIYDSFFDGRNILCVATEIIEEYEESLCRLTNKDVALNTIDAIVNNPYTLEIDRLPCDSYGYKTN